jgi:hypothetical protein
MSTYAEMIAPFVAYGDAYLASDEAARCYDPEHHLAVMGQVVIDEPLPVRGLTAFWEGWTKLDPCLNARERRSTAAHEVAHVERGPVTGYHTPREERACNKIAAARLISLDALIDAVKWTDSLEELAELLDVDFGMLTVRLRMLTAEEGARFDRWGAARRGAGGGRGAQPRR